MIDDENKELHILGDLNCNMLTNNPNHPTKTLKGILETYQLSQLNTEATRITTTILAKTNGTLARLFI